MIDQNLVLAIIAISQAITALFTWLAHKSAKDTQADVRKIELATNSMKDALVKATGIASDAQGFERGRKEGEIKAAALIESPLPVSDEKTAAAVEKVVEAIKENTSPLSSKV